MTLNLDRLLPSLLVTALDHLWHWVYDLCGILGGSHTPSVPRGQGLHNRALSPLGKRTAKNLVSLANRFEVRAGPTDPMRALVMRNIAADHPSGDQFSSGQEARGASRDTFYQVN
ncbi:unnamed protein product [Penicillium pancosmium]